MRTAIVRKSDYIVLSTYEGSPNQTKYGGEWQDASSYEHISYDEAVLGQSFIAQDDGQGGIELVIS